jgi:hypothetical protein
MNQELSSWVLAPKVRKEDTEEKETETSTD